MAKDGKTPKDTRTSALEHLKEQPHHLKVWELSTGDIIEYKEATCIGGFKREGTHRIMVPLSGVIREYLDITLFEIDGLKVYL